MNRNSMFSRWLFVTDVDDTLLGDNTSLVDLTNALKPKREHVFLAFNSSRPCASVRKSIRENALIPEPNFLIGALGTEIETGGDGQLMKEYSKTISPQWNREEIVTLVHQIGLQAHPDEFQTPYKASYHVNEEEQYKHALDLLTESNIDVKVIFSGRTNLDFIPVNAGKGAAIQYLRAHLGVDMDRVVAAGDSMNDLDMFMFPNKVIVVANAEKEIKSLQGEHIYQARSEYAAGVLEGLRYWGVL